MPATPTLIIVFDFSGAIPLGPQKWIHDSPRPTIPYSRSVWKTSYPSSSRYHAAAASTSRAGMIGTAEMNVVTQKRRISL